MKKIFGILLLTITTFMLSSCFIFVNDKEHDITCENNTSVLIRDWCVIQDGDRTHANSDYAVEIRPGYSDTIYDLPEDYYSVCITFNNPSSSRNYQPSEEIYLDEDVVFSVAERTFYRRSANDSSEDEDAEPEFVLIGSNGKEYPLIPTNRQKQFCGG